MLSRPKHTVDPNRSTVHRASTKPDSRESKQYNGNKSPYYSKELSQLDAASSDEQTSIPVESNFIHSKNHSVNSEYMIPRKLKKFIKKIKKKIKPRNAPLSPEAGNDNTSKISNEICHIKYVNKYKQISHIYI